MRVLKKQGLGLLGAPKVWWSLINIWLVVSILSVILFALEAGLVGKEVPFELILAGQLSKWFIWMVISVPILHFSLRYSLDSVKNLFIHLGLTVVAVFTFLLLYNSLLFLSEGVKITGDRFLQNLKLIVIQDLLSLLLFFVLLVLITKWIFKKVDVAEPIKFPTRLTVKTGEAIEMISIEDISQISAFGYCVKIFTPQKTYVMRKSMNNLEKLLDPGQFIRIHRSSIVNLNYLDKMISKGGDHKMVLTSGETLDVSKRKASSVRKAVNGKAVNAAN